MEERAIGVLKFCAWIHLVVCIAAAILWIGGSPNPPGIVTGVLLTVAGLTGWAFFLVVCLMAETLIEIRTNTAQPAKSRLFDRDAR
jgi:hypothetical protein